MVAMDGLEVLPPSTPTNTPPPTPHPQLHLPPLLSPTTKSKPGTSRLPFLSHGPQVTNSSLGFKEQIKTSSASITHPPPLSLLLHH
ncbi:hypothetical protein Q7C36_001854 [Tachysurus vachellii]|uniref:Uncharacterized protein n=1 Tax=Tachysurus vachellii TaxID=175792 RepID=A0AA88NV57_TACVA|nr:hypothetical protein Q7C36_001854 [Tachysurus vachellii]